VEEVIYEHPAVQDVAVIGVPDPIMGEEIKAFVVLKPGYSITDQELIPYCQESLGKFKCPKYIEFVDLIPRNPVGKVLRQDLRQRHSNQ
jgi:acyl-coenzyme A synthetase/AMP-(fatty) acid ligase